MVKRNKDVSKVSKSAIVATGFPVKRYWQLSNSIGSKTLDGKLQKATTTFLDINLWNW